MGRLCRRQRGSAAGRDPGAEGGYAIVTVQHNDYTVDEAPGGRNHRSVPDRCLYTIPEVSSNCYRDASKSNDKDEKARTTHDRTHFQARQERDAIRPVED